MNKSKPNYSNSISENWEILLQSPNELKRAIFPSEKFSQPPLYLCKDSNETGIVPTIVVRHERGKVKFKVQRYRGFEITIKEGSFGSGSADTFIVISCNLNSYTDQFIKFSQNITDLIVDGQTPSEAIRSGIRAWLDFFKKSGSVLETNELVGLYGELSLLKELLSLNIHPEKIIDGWGGPMCEPWDFTLGFLSPVHCIEVKTTIRPKTQIAIHGIDQLWAAKQEVNYWLNFRMVQFHQIDDQQTRGSIVELINEISTILDSINQPHVLTEFNDALTQVGYSQNMKDHYIKQKLQAFDSKWYIVNDSFPSLSRHTIAPHIFERVEKLSYALNLNGLKDEPNPLKNQEVKDDCQKDKDH